jgi:hypothetical protein
MQTEAFLGLAVRAVFRVGELVRQLWEICMQTEAFLGFAVRVVFRGFLYIWGLTDMRMQLIFAACRACVIEYSWNG